tara:strand:+ start:112 stop:360 length:249 start_codon:yes stop_codon:yes gene_type:complete
MEKQVLTTEEIKKLKDFQEKQSSLLYQLGQVEYQLTYFERNKKEIQKQLEAFEEEQKQMAQTLENKYGMGTVNVENGEFIKA